jgi:hypothetical protein
MSQASVAQGWAHCLKGDPVTDRGKRIQKIKVLVFTMIPTLFLLGQNVDTFITSAKYLKSAENLRKDVLFSTDAQAGGVMHFLQEERGKTVLYVSSGGDAALKNSLMLVYNATDTAINALTAWPTPTEGARHVMQDREVFHHFIKKHREQLRHDTTTVEKEIEFYAELINEMIGWISSNVREAPIGYIWKSLVAYHMLLLSKEQAGVERALGGVFYTQGKGCFV